MKIIDSRKKTVEFRSIKLGEVFLNDENCLMMRMEDTDGENGFNAVNLQNGEIALFCYADEVTPVKAGVTIFE